MFEHIRGLPPDGAGCSGLELVFLAGLNPDPGFVAGALEQFRRLRDHKPWLPLAGLAGDVAERHDRCQADHGLTGAASDLALFGAALSAALVQRLGGEEATLSLSRTPNTARISFEPGGAFVHTFALLYSVNFMHNYWREGVVEPRLEQLLDVAEMFFAHDQGVMALDQVPALEAVFPQETINSFVNLVHPPLPDLGRLLTKILLLEDNRELGEVIADMLSSCGYVVCQAADGMSGLGRLERERFHLILSDIQMPRLNGMGLLKVLRQRRVGIPVILTTGFTDIWREEQALQQGAAAFLPKPFGMAELVRTVDKVLSGPSAALPGDRPLF